VSLALCAVRHQCLIIGLCHVCVIYMYIKQKHVAEVCKCYMIVIIISSISVYFHLCVMLLTPQMSEFIILYGITEDNFMAIAMCKADAVRQCVVSI